MPAGGKIMFVRASFPIEGEEYWIVKKEELQKLVINLVGASREECSDIFEKINMN